jgi:tetratricopeptide (TPR) repeat protein
VKRRLIVLIIALSSLIVGAYLVLINPNNPLTNLFRSKISDADANIVIGPYPLEDDIRLLKDHNVTTIVSLLDPNLPYENTLLEREKALAQKYQIEILNFPMASIFGQRIGSYYAENAAAAAEAITKRAGKVYLHCYLGMHRVKVVEQLLRTRQFETGTYLIHQGERSQDAKLLDRAQSEYESGHHDAALETLKGIKQMELPARLLQAWATYRLGDITAARELFGAILQSNPESSDARAGAGYCALRENDLALAEQSFSAALQADANYPSALVGLGFVQYRQGKLIEAARTLETALKLDPRNEEVKEILSKIATYRKIQKEPKR